MLDNVLNKINPQKEDISHKKHRLSITAVCLDLKKDIVFSASKDGSIFAWFYKKKDLVRLNNSITNSSVISLAVSPDGMFVCSGEKDGRILIWSIENRSLYKEMNRHKKPVTGLLFENRNSIVYLYSCAEDKRIFVWNFNQFSYVETLFGHQTNISDIKQHVKEEILTAGTLDRSIRLWKLKDKTSLVYEMPNTAPGSVSSVTSIDGNFFVSGTDSGSIFLWQTNKRKFVYMQENCHGINNEIISLSSCVIEDEKYFASGSIDGFVRIWKFENFSFNQYKKLSIKGALNSLILKKEILICGSGQEKRLGRWIKIKEGKNRVFILKWL